MASDNVRASDRSTGDPEDGEPCPGVVFDVLADERNRLVLHLLRARGGTTAVEELAARLVEYDAATGRDLLPTESERGVATYLHLVVLPALAEHGLVTYDRTDRAVTFAAGDGKLEAYLEFARTREPPRIAQFVEDARRTEE